MRLIVTTSVLAFVLLASRFARADGEDPIADAPPVEQAPPPAPAVAPTVAGAQGAQEEGESCDGDSGPEAYRGVSAIETRHPLLGSSAGLVRNGGPILAIGPRFDEPATRLRAGYEIGFGRSVIVAGVVEGDGSRRVAVVPTIELASSSWAHVFPSIGLGVGAPVQWRKDEPAYGGVRGQATLSWRWSAIVFTYDRYPAAPAGSKVETALAFQISF